MAMLVEQGFCTDNLTPAQRKNKKFLRGRLKCCLNRRGLDFNYITGEYDIVDPLQHLDTVTQGSDVTSDTSNQIVTMTNVHRLRKGLEFAAKLKEDDIHLNCHEKMVKKVHYQALICLFSMDGFTGKKGQLKENVESIWEENQSCEEKMSHRIDEAATLVDAA